MNLVVVGHVDHGKSSIVGRLLADTGSLPQGKLEQIKEFCERNSRPFEYAFLIDALKDEQSQGITIDSARVFFKTKKRDYIIIDAPGHIEFLKNMVTGASRAEAALLVIDANEGIQENSKRHGYMLSMLGINQISILVNKMDLVGYEKEVFETIKKEYSKFLAGLGIKPKCFIPVSGIEGDNIASPSSRMPWYKEKTILKTLDKFESEKPKDNQHLRMPVQDVYKFTNFGDDRRIIAGTIETGVLRKGDEVVFYPSGKRSVVQNIEKFNSPEKSTVHAGSAVGFTLKEQIYAQRGEMIAKDNESKPQVTSRIKVNLFWLNKDSMSTKKEYLLKLGTAKVPVVIESIKRVIDSSDLKSLGKRNAVKRHEVAECILKLSKAIAFDLVTKNASTSRFVIIDNYEIAGGGIIQDALEDKQTWVRDKVFLRNYNWIKSQIASEDRAERYSQKPALVLITGKRNAGRKRLARKLENKLFEEGKMVYFLGIGNIIHGVDADIEGKRNVRREHFRRLAEVAHLLLDAGLVLIVSAIELTQDDLNIIKTTVNPDIIETVWIGKQKTTDIDPSLKLTSLKDMDKAVNDIESVLQDKGVFRI